MSNFFFSGMYADQPLGAVQLARGYGDNMRPFFANVRPVLVFTGTSIAPSKTDTTAAIAPSKTDTTTDIQPDV